MPHILILDETLELLNQVNVYSHAIKENIDGNEYHGSQLSQANDAQAAVETLAGEINDRFREEIESKIEQQEAVLGI